MNSILTALLLILILLISWCIYKNIDTNFNDDNYIRAWEPLTMQFSDITKKKYGIQETLPKTKEAVNMIAQMDLFIDKFVAYLDGKNPNDRRVKRLVNRIHDTKIEESPFEPDTSSYTLNKGDLIALCVRSKENPNTLHDYQTMQFVVIHELAHVASVTRGHGAEFVSTFKWLLHQASESGMYSPVDYSKSPITYCGVRVTNNPMLS
jgi:hypothetical protein